MKKFLAFILVVLAQLHPFVLEGQDINDNTPFLKSIQGTWAYTDSDSELWMKVVIKGKTLRAFAGYPKSGKFTAESVQKIRVVKLVYKSKYNKGLKSESFAQIGKSALSDDRLYSGIIDGKKYIFFGNKESQKFMKVPADFNPWE